MSSPLPTSSDGFAVTVSFAISPEVWNAVIPLFYNRLVAIEDVISSGYTAAQQAGTAMAQAIIQQSVTPQLVQVNETIADFDQQLALAEDRLAALNNGGVVAANVTITPIAGLDATNAQAAILELAAYLAAEAQARTDAIAAIKPIQFAQLTVDTALASGGAYRLRAAGRTHTLPAAPATGDTIRITDGEVLSATATVTIARNGKTIMGLAENLTLNVAGLDCLLWYSGTDWRLF